MGRNTFPTDVWTGDLVVSPFFSLQLFLTSACRFLSRRLCWLSSPSPLLNRQIVLMRILRVYPALVVAGIFRLEQVQFTFAPMPQLKTATKKRRSVFLSFCIFMFPIWKQNEEKGGKQREMGTRIVHHDRNIYITCSSLYSNIVGLIISQPIYRGNGVVGEEAYRRFIFFCSYISFCSCSLYVFVFIGLTGKCAQEFDYRKYSIPRRRGLIGRTADGLNVQLILNGSSIAYTDRVTLSNASRVASERLAQTMWLDVGVITTTQKNGKRSQRERER